MCGCGERAQPAKTLKEIIVASTVSRSFQFVIKTLRPTCRIILLSILLLTAVVTFLWQRDSSEAIEPVTILSEPFKIPATARDRFTMTLGANKKWVSRAEHAIFGERKSVRVSADILQLSGPALTNLTKTFTLPAPIFTTNGLKIWFLADAALKKIGEADSATSGVQVMTRPRIETADGIAGSMFMGQSMPTKAGGMAPVGFAMSCAATVRDDSTILLTQVAQSEFGDGIVQTNFAINARLNIPNGQGTFLMQPPTGSATNGWGVVIHPLR